MKLSNFDILKFNNGYDKVCTRDKRIVTIISVDQTKVKPILAHIDSKEEDSPNLLMDYYIDGTYNGSSIPSIYDLFFYELEKDQLSNFERMYISIVNKTIDNIKPNELIKFKAQARTLLHCAQKTELTSKKDQFLFKKLIGILSDIRNMCQANNDILIINKLISWLKTKFIISENEKKE